MVQLHLKPESVSDRTDPSHISPQKTRRDMGRPLFARPKEDPALNSVGDPDLYTSTAVGGKISLPVQRNCHCDRSVAQQRDLLFASSRAEVASVLGHPRRRELCP
jgi:hypothetical protein